ncbi:hypothetical protein FQR65_LT20522 [Abscondita terminalis]|nr:hypothetical protein FQR65_LT20522 [Abscondita terminalis]
MCNCCAPAACALSAAPRRRRRRMRLTRFSRVQPGRAGETPGGWSGGAAGLALLAQHDGLPNAPPSQASSGASRLARVAHSVPRRTAQKPTTTPADHWRHRADSRNAPTRADTARFEHGRRNPDGGVAEIVGTGQLVVLAAADHDVAARIHVAVASLVREIQRPGFGKDQHVAVVGVAGDVAAGAQHALPVGVEARQADAAQRLLGQFAPDAVLAVADDVDAVIHIAHDLLPPQQLARRIHTGGAVHLCHAVPPLGFRPEPSPACLAQRHCGSGSWTPCQQKPAGVAIGSIDDMRALRSAGGVVAKAQEDGQGQADERERYGRDRDLHVEQVAVHQGDDGREHDVHEQRDLDALQHRAPQNQEKAQAGGALTDDHGDF